MRYFYNPGTKAAESTFLLLHGTGGKETDLLSVSQDIEIKNAVLAVRGNVEEAGALRFFKRLVDGSPDQTDVTTKTNELQDLLNQASEQHHFAREHVIAIGYSNGANMAGSWLFHEQKAFKGAILFHPMEPRSDIELPDLTGIPIFISAGATDSLVPPGDSMKLKKTLERAGANVTFYLTDYGHELANSEVEAAAEWYEKHFG